jgi:serine/threonine-protein kinase
MPGPSPTDPVDFQAGEFQLGPYRLLRPISAGGMARVYEGRLDSLAGVTTRVAVKVIHPDFATEAAFQELFITEARISARLEHQNLVRIQQFNRQGELYYLVMEYIEGITFRKIISLCRRHRVQLPVELIAELGRQVCEGLHYAHHLANEHGEPLHLVHRDIKPSNLMLNTHGVAKVLDFGISSAHGTPENAGAVKGTWGYMALEQAEGHVVGPGADVFGLGAVLYELAALEPLFGEKENAVVRQRLLEDAAAARAAALGGAYADLGGVLVRALQRDPDARHRSAAVFGRALSSLVVDPVGVHDGLVRMLRDLRALDQPAPGDAAAVAAGQEKARSVSTMSRAGLPPRGSPRIEPAPALPVRFGDVHGAGPAARHVRARPPNGRLRATLAASALLAVALTVLGFAAWQLVFGTPRRVAPSAAVAQPAGAAPVASARPAPAPSAPAPSAPAPSAPAPSAPAPSASVAAPAVPPAVVQPAGTAPSAGTTAPAHPPAPAPATVAVPPHGASTRAGSLAASAPTVAPPVPSDDTPVRIPPPAAVPAPTAAPTPAPAALVGAPPAAAEHGATGLLTVSSMPRAQVMVDGQYVRYTPIYQHAVSTGSHTVLLVAEDGRRKSFKVSVDADVETRRIWLFDEERWSDQ